MTAVQTTQRPISLKSIDKTGVASQFGALCYRIKDRDVQILLITSRGTGRWIIPKGWPMHKATPAEAAAREAYEEAGVVGKTYPVCIGLYSYEKPLEEPAWRIVNVFPCKVKNTLKKFPEAGQRKRKWLSRKKAAARVDEPELAEIIRHFDPKRLRL